MTLLRRVLVLPLASATGCALAVLAGLVCVLAAPTCGASTMTPFVACAIPALLGLWLDWARLYPVTRRAIRVSGAALVAALALELVLAPLGAPELVPVTSITLAVTLVAGARVVHWLATRARSEWGVMTGVVRREDRDRVLMVAGSDVIELDRDAADLGGRRALEITVGGPLAVLACFDAEVAPDLYRGEPRLRARRVLAAGADVPSVRRRLFARARSWALYACALALLTALVGAALTPAPARECHVPVSVVR